MLIFLPITHPKLSTIVAEFFVSLNMLTLYLHIRKKRKKMKKKQIPDWSVSSPVEKNFRKFTCQRFLEAFESILQLKQF